jgi:methyl-accepting chemotaxis protein
MKGTETGRIKRNIALTVYGVLGVFLFASEFLNAVFNNRLDRLGFTFVERVVFAAKPTVFGLYVVIALGLYVLILRYLKPLFRYLDTGEGYDRARKAAVNVPWVIIVFQSAAWTIATFLYYMGMGWTVESGIPLLFGLPLKIAVGLPSGVYISIIFNLILIQAKQQLNITALAAGEDDRFSRNRDFFVVLAIIIVMIVNFAYISFYYANASVSVSLASFYLPLVGVAVFYGVVSFGLIALSKREYQLQIDSIRVILRRMAAGDARVDTRINIINYNELGEIAGYVNEIVDNFAGIIAKINETSGLVLESSQTLSSASRENAAYANQQASSTTEIVTTMEEVDALSHEIGSQAGTVEESAHRMRTEIDTGFSTTKQTIDTMESVRTSNAETITEIKNLGDHIRNIWEIVKIINGIAGQIKIIAFNATLEAASAGEAGKNFEIVASEIRRLADNTVASTAEIRSRIEQIQSAADALIHSSQTDTEHISRAWTLSQQQETTFDTLLSLSDSSSDAAAAMSGRVSQQIGAFEQVLVTLKQISAGIHEFSESIDETNRTADRLNETAATLNEIVGDSATQGATRGVSQRETTPGDRTGGTGHS